jgi:hypothetical protein
MTEQELSKMISEFLPYPAEGQHHALKQFAKLVAAAEREACAKVCEQPIDEIQITDDCSELVYMGGKECAFAIRERGAP